MKIEGSFPARTSIAMSSNFRNSIPAEVGAIYDEYSSLFAKLTHKQGNSDIFDDPLFDPYWLYQALDKAIQGGSLELELENAQSTTERYLLCVRSNTTTGTCARMVDKNYKGTGPISQFR